MRYLGTAAILAALTIAACAPEKPEIVARNPSGDQTQVAVVAGDESFTLEQVTQRLDVMPDWARARFATVDRKKSFLATTVQFELLHDEAQKLGYQRHPDTIHHLEQRLVEAWLDEQVEKKPISPDDLREHFEANKENFRRGLARKSYIFKTSDRARAEELRQRISAADDRIEAFKSAARLFSLDFATAQNGGLIGGITERGEVVSAEGSGTVTPDDDPVGFADTVWKLDEGELGQPMEMGDDWFVVMWSGEVPAEQVEFDNLASEVRKHLLDQKRRKLLGSYQK